MPVVLRSLWDHGHPGPTASRRSWWRRRHNARRASAPTMRRPRLSPCAASGRAAQHVRSLVGGDSRSVGVVGEVSEAHVLGATRRGCRAGPNLRRNSLNRSGPGGVGRRRLRGSCGPASEAHPPAQKSGAGLVRKPARQWAGTGRTRLRCRRRRVCRWSKADLAKLGQIGPRTAPRAESWQEEQVIVNILSQRTQLRMEVRETHCRGVWTLCMDPRSADSADAPKADVCSQPQRRALRWRSCLCVPR